MNAVSLSEWQPLKSVGGFEFSSPVSGYRMTVGLKRDESLDAPGSGWQVYALLDPEMRIYEDSNGIVSIACYDALYYRGSNLMGATVDEAIEIIGRQPSRVGEPLWVSEDEQQRTIEFDELGLMLWFGAERIVISADCSN